MRRVPAPAAAVVVSLLAGGLTSYGQTVLPYAVAPLANSAGSWCAVAFLLALPARRPWVGALSAGISLAGLVVGYYAVADLRGFGVSLATVAFWLVAAVTVGPALGLSAVWWRRGSRARQLASAFTLPVVLVAEGTYALGHVAATTSNGYWWAEIVVGGLLAVGLGARAVR